MSRKKEKNSTPSIPNAPAPAALGVEKPVKIPVSDAELLNIAFKEFCAVVAKHSGAVFVEQPPDNLGQMVFRVRGVERVEAPGSKTVTLKFKEVPHAPAASPGMAAAPVGAPK